MTTLKVRNPATGVWEILTATGPAGEAGSPALIIGDFGVSKVPGNLPVDGNIPADWDEVGDPAHQMVLGECLFYHPTDPYLPQAGHLFSFVTALNNPTGWVDSGRIQGEMGPQGMTGVSTVIIGSFGNVATPVDLPPDGILPIDWDGPGQPTAPYQMIQGESLYYDNATDPLDGHMFQYVTLTVDPAGWIDIGLIQGPPGVEGPPGPPGVGLDEVVVGPDDPITTVPSADVWYDTDALDPPPQGMDGFVQKQHVYFHHVYGPATSVASTFTWTLAAGTYLCQFQCSGVATATGIRYINFDMDLGAGWVNIGQSKHWFNAVSVHHQMNQGVSLLTVPADGDYPCRMSPSASLTMDQNDFGHITLIPAGA